MALTDRIVYGLDDYLRRRTPPAWPSWQYLFLVWPFLAMGLGLLIEGTHAAKISARQAHAAAMVTGYDTANHHESEYSFSVAGVEYRGQSSPWKSELPIGSSTTVYYDTSAPIKNALTPFEVEAANDLDIATALLSISAVLFAAVCLSKVWMRRKHQR